MTPSRRTLTSFGFAAPAASIGLVSLATLVDPKFSWATRSLSSMGESTGLGVFAVDSANQLAWLLFNGGLFAGGLLGLPFVALLVLDARNAFERVGAVGFGVALVCMAGVGVAFLESDAAPAPFDELHFLFAVLLFFSIGVVPWLYGSGMVLADDARAGLATIWLANLYAVQWVVWIVLEAFAFTGDGDTWTYFAVPEFVGAVVLGGWAAWLAARKRRAA
ncbi:DUF998 domain-containing protein [Halorubellus sp. JP-L1]|uniref:DUF998 domain-containing protein n=1 Tax=Halorubellus sp. JP-L1 TaxID=2715753 RepID=UPI00140C20EF|nr:DUF998 domain-containing protein [Halorubellus sp. JP-L1]NHN40220.1 DUF998 domain-containing protein [Halorubellus sp. JP-L1]